MLAHEYYRHRYYREEYYSDYRISPSYHSTPVWKDECRASITAAKLAPGLNQLDKSNLVMDAIYRAKEYGQLIEMDDFMKEVVYGYPSDEKNITCRITPIKYVREERNMLARKAKRDLLKTSYTEIQCPKCRKKPEIMVTLKGERTIVSCECGYLYDCEFNL